MKERIKEYIFRSWKDEPFMPHPGLRFIPPIVFDLLAWLVIGSLLVQFVLWLYEQV